MLTEQQKKEYIANDGTKCPYCGSIHIQCEGHDIDGPTALFYTTCTDCGKTWTDIYTLTGIAEDEP